MEKGGVLLPPFQCFPTRRTYKRGSRVRASSSRRATARQSGQKMNFENKVQVETQVPVETVLLAPSEIPGAEQRLRKRTKKRTAEWDKVPCVLCNKSYRTFAYLRKHMVAKHRVCNPVVQIRCEFCGSLFSDRDQFRYHAEHTSREIANETGVVADLRQDQLEFSRTLRRLAREEVQEDEAAKRETALRVAETFFDCDTVETPVD